MRRLLFCVGASACAMVHGAEPDPASLLVRSAEAARVVNYQGVVIYRGDERFEVLRVQHRFKNDSERERMVSLTGEPRQLVRIDNRMIAILPKGQTLSVERPQLRGFLSQLTVERVLQLKQYYDFKDEGEGRIAGRPCRGILVAPRDGYRYGYEVWTDDESSLPLKISLISDHDEVLEQVMYTEVSFPDSIPDSAFETEVDVSKFNLITRTLPKLDVAPVPVANGEQEVTFDKLPPGFRIVSHDSRPMPDGNGQVEHVLLSDGLSAVSVFTAVQRQEEKGLSGISHMGPVQAYGRSMGTLHVTIVGEVPATTIRMIGDDLRLPIPGITAPSSSDGPVVPAKPMPAKAVVPQTEDDRN